MPGVPPGMSLAEYVRSRKKKESESKEGAVSSPIVNKIIVPTINSIEKKIEESLNVKSEEKMTSKSNEEKKDEKKKEEGSIVKEIINNVSEEIKKEGTETLKVVTDAIATPKTPIKTPQVKSRFPDIYSTVKMAASMTKKPTPKAIEVEIKNGPITAADKELNKQVLNKLISGEFLKELISDVR